MKKIVLVFMLLYTGLAVSAQGPTTEQESFSAAAHVQRAKEVGGPELAFHAEGIICQPAPAQIPYALNNIPHFLNPKAPAVEPFAAFDNLYYVGPYAVGTWILDTGDGLILFDALNNEGEVKRILLPGMKQLGLDPNDLKYLVITHAHFDHYGGAHYLQQTYGVRVIMSAADWKYFPNDIALPWAMKKGYPGVTPPEMDMVVNDGDTLTLGDATVTFWVTPGHTPGTLSPIFPVRDGDNTHFVGMWGGNALHENIKELTQMHDSLHRFQSLARQQAVEGLISTHAWVTGSFRLHAKGRVDGRHPMVFGKDGVDRYLDVIDECISAQFARSNAKQLLGS
ncbi:MBL fold metallo-hydrolase [Pseudomaricurvus alkylphenolicus]|uniref:MBL fold metallo-hydrolase n=1 Tax=Pseudomaricurvus alkylphenolicus TaxID=1306991 RepID=UPI00141E72A4|nr:MBL fold metallo-hydrolase [Pseudomaricurvus alkylphenolicus]NIB42354.1 MBL fold metallo-hydrolase [Pseudomaricurvus alkylphenolicus]